MCPVCFGSVAWLITGGVSGLGATAGGLAIVRYKRIAARNAKHGRPGPAGRFSRAFSSEAPVAPAVQDPKGRGESNAKE